MSRARLQGTNRTPYISQPSSAPGTTTDAQYSRPTTPTGSYYASDLPPPNTAPLGPSRQQLSELRHRPNYSTDRVSAASQDPYRDSVTTIHSDIAAQNPLPSKTPVQDQPGSLHSALAAFRSAGSRRRQPVEEGESYHLQQERERELEAERARQQRIRDKAPGVRGKSTKVGEIDGMLNIQLSLYDLTFRFSCFGPSQRWLGVRH